VHVAYQIDNRVFTGIAAIVVAMGGILGKGKFCEGFMGGILGSGVWVKVL